MQVDAPRPRSVFVSSAGRNVSEPAQIAEGQLAEAVDLVMTDAVVEWRGARRGLGLEPCVEDGDRGLPVQGAMGMLAVVVAAAVGPASWPPAAGE